MGLQYIQKLKLRLPHGDEENDEHHIHGMSPLSKLLSEVFKHESALACVRGRAASCGRSGGSVSGASALAPLHFVEPGP